MEKAEPLHIALAAPVATEQVRRFLAEPPPPSLQGYMGAPLTGVIIGELLRAGHKVSAFTTDNTMKADAAAKRFLGENFEFVVCPSRRHAWRFNGRRPGRIVDLFSDERAVLCQAMRAARPQIVHAHWTYEFALAALSSGISTLVTCHDSPARVLKLTRSPYRALRYMMAKKVFKEGRYFTTVSEYMASELKSQVVAPIAVVPNPVACEAFERGRIRSQPGSHRLCMVGNGWGRRKNPQPALRAFALWRTAHPGAELHLFGIDFEVDGLAHRWASSEGITDGLVFHGRVSHDDLIVQLSEFDLLLHPALEESFGVVLAEAMALGLPIVAGRHSGAVPDVVGHTRESPSRCAVLTDVASVDSILSSIRQAFDPQYGARSAAGYRRARDLFSPEMVTKKYVDIYRNVLAGNGISNDRAALPS